MLSREVIIGIAILCQLLYSVVYPYAEETLQSLPQFAHEVDSKLLSKYEAIRSVLFGTAPDAVKGAAAHDDSSIGKAKNPQGSSKDRRKSSSGKSSLSRQEVVERAVKQRMMPHMSTITQMLQNNDKINTGLDPGVRIKWDVHRITDADVPWAYFFRLEIENTSPRPCLLQGIGRFYVLQSPDGLVFPIHRLTEGPAGFMLNSGEDYKYAWVFLTKYKTVEASGGILLENRTQPDTDVRERFLNTTLVPLQPSRAKGISFDAVNTMVQNYNFMGVLDLRGATYV